MGLFFCFCFCFCLCLGCGAFCFILFCFSFVLFSFVLAFFVLNGGGFVALLLLLVEAVGFLDFFQHFHTYFAQPLVELWDCTEGPNGKGEAGAWLETVLIADSSISSQEGDSCYLRLSEQYKIINFFFSHSETTQYF